MELQAKISRLRNRIAQIPKIVPEHTAQGHFYRLGNNVYPSVTAKLQVVKDEGLRMWYMNRALDYVRNHVGTIDFKIDIFDQQVDELIAKAKEAPVIEFRDAGDIGTRIHNRREEWFKDWIDQGVKPPLDLYIKRPVSETEEEDIRITSGMRAINRFIDDCGYIPLACEVLVYDPILELAGTLDDVGLLPNKDGGHDLVIIDVKTSNIGNKDSYYYQVALYIYMFRKLSGLRPSKNFILHISKFDGYYDLIPLKDVPTLIKEAKVILKLNKALDRLHGAKKKGTQLI